MTSETTLGKQLKLVISANIFFIAIDYQQKTNIQQCKHGNNSAVFYTTDSWGSLFIEIDYQQKTNMKAAASSVNIKTIQLFSMQRISGVLLTIVYTAENFGELA